MLAGNTLTEKNDDMILNSYDQCLKMAGCNSHETPNMYRNLSVPPSNEQQFRLREDFMTIIDEEKHMEN